ncbi:LysR substrate-binding domain-containing protein [Asticcacaulis sp. 201]|uniref:LysR substrate-binding domain-containing protein n=1 Tax=Asticcacaulis sp. 201 TaxID=3028787 RepID=UPI002915EF27|nr:LysR substrate-binding domain-containing protein [Asticcacaulis sp. 201]MDV6329911.1 LysR substrate-binding domain-containing protein [Asticcacaulis sp. 201]
MKRGRLPLTALRSFEAAGRLHSFTAAADELCVSQAAISRQIRDLESELGHALFERRHRAVILTDQGVKLLSVLTQSFDNIDATLRTLRSDRASPLVRISVEPSFAACWLIPHLPEFQRDHPDIDLVVDSDPRLVQFRAQDADIAIRYSRARHAWPRTESRRLANVDMIPVMTPALHDRDGHTSNPADLLRYVLLHEENRDGWAQWFSSAGMELPATTRGPVLPDGGLVLQAALRGQGIALIDRILVADEIAAGRLIQVSDLSLPYGAYFIVARNFNRLSEPAKQLTQWLTDRVIRTKI